MALTVSALADQTGLSPDTVRYYERVGLLPQPARSAAGYRLYDQTAIGRLQLIKSAQRAGLRLREIGELLQVALPVGDEPEPEPVLPQRLQDGQRVVVEREIVVPLPLAHDLDRTRAGQA